MKFSPEKVNQFRDRSEQDARTKKESIQTARAEKYLEEQGQVELVESLKTESPVKTVKQIIESKGDYVGLAKVAGLEDRLREIATVEGENSEYYQFTVQSEKNFFNSFVKYLRSQRNLDKMYLQSRRVLNIVREMRNNGFEAVETIGTLKKYNKELDQAESSIDDFTHTNPEIYIASNIKRLRDYKKEMQKASGETGRINETPYVKKQLAQVQSCIVDGKPIFIHGHLGAGKTEMALRASYNYLKENKTDEEIAENVQVAYGEWLKNNPGSSDAEKAQVLEEIKKESRTAVVISGSRETSTTDFTGHRTINISTFEEEAKKYKLNEASEEFKKWEAENPEASEAQLNMHWNGLLKVYLEKSGGTFSNFFIGPIYRAMREGRPVIIDEVDAIPPDALIFLNHIMTRKPGDVLPVQGDSGQRVTVKKGFCVILTGNFPKANQADKYLGRSQMDAAFLSRLQKLEHDYLPQSLDSNTAFEAMDPKDMKKNELFHVLVASVMDRYGSLNLPEGEEEKLWRLSCFSRHIQNIFSDRHSKLMEGANTLQSQQELREKLHKEVLSMRQLLDIIREWQNPTAIRGKNEGLMRYELDHYVLEYFIKRTPEEETKWMLYKVAQEQFGLFQNDGWPDAPTDQETQAGAGVVPKFNIESPKIETGDLKKMLPSKVVEMCYGPIPEYDYDIKEVDEPSESDIEAAIERERELDEIEKEMARLEKIRKGEDPAESAGITHEQYLADIHPSMRKIYSKLAFEDEQMKTVESIVANPANVHIDQEIAFEEMAKLNADNDKIESNKSQIGELYMNSETVDFEKAKLFVPEIPEDIKKQGSVGILEYIHKTYKDTHILPDFKYYQYLAELKEKADSETHPLKRENILNQIPDQFRDGHWYNFPGSVFVGKKGGWDVPALNFSFASGGSSFATRRVGYLWGDDERIVLLEK